jgi:hypothetical protein
MFRLRQPAKLSAQLDQLQFLIILTSFFLDQHNGVGTLCYEFDYGSDASNSENSLIELLLAISPGSVSHQ